MHKLDTLFLDRDGVINVKLDGRYVRSFEEFEFIAGAEFAIANLTRVFKRILIITNQQGISKGIMSIEDLNSLHQNMLRQLRVTGGVIEKIYYCPHLATENCICRKPNTGMIKQAIIDFPDLENKNSYLVGDSDSDIMAGNEMGLITVKVDSQYTLAKWSEELLNN
jgi:histidinol-phosphate phosphatase family protein